MRKYILSSFFMIACYTCCLAQQLAVTDYLYPAQSASISGFIGGRLEAAYDHRILAQDVDRLVAPFRNRTETSCWQSEFWGKWFTSAVLAYRYHPSAQLKARLDTAVSALIRTQSAEGYIGNYAEEKRLDAWDIWGRKYCMLGLLAHYDLTGNTTSLVAAKKIADHLIGELKAKQAILVKKGNHRGMAASSVLEPIVQLYRYTNDKRYLDFALEIVREWETSDGPQLISKSGVPVASRFPKPNSWFGWEQGQKAYEMMSCYEGLLELYRITGKTEYRQAVEQTWTNINETEINIAGSGSSVECWFGGKHLQTLPVSHYQETCVTATWIKLSQQLLRLTGEVKYADAIEQTYYNALLGAMKTDGSDWAKYSPLAGKRLEGEEQCGMGLNCCVASGPRGLFTLPLTTVMRNKTGLQVNFFAAGHYETLTPTGQHAELVATTDYPVSGTILLKLVIAKNENMNIAVRIPAWSKQSVLTVNGEAVNNIVAGGYAVISRVWKTGDQISLSLDMRGRLVRMGDQPANTAIVRGPVVLARDTRFGGPSVDEAAQPIANKEGFIDLEPVANASKDIWMQFKAPFIFESHKETGPRPVQLILCDYLSAGNTHTDDSRFRVWIPQLYDPK